MQIWGTQPENINEAEDRDLWYSVLTKLGIQQPPGTMVTSEEQALVASKDLGYPVMVRPSFVLGGRAMEIVYRSSPPPTSPPSRSSDTPCRCTLHVLACKQAI